MYYIPPRHKQFAADLFCLLHVCREHDRIRCEVWAVYWVNSYNNKKCIVFLLF